MTLTAFGPSLHDIGNVLAKQTEGGKFLEVLQGFVGIACGKGTTEAVERGAVPKDLVAALREHPVLCPKLRREHGFESSFCTVVDAHSQWDAYPGAEHVVAVVVAIGVVAFDGGMEELVDVLAKGCSLLPIGGRLLSSCSLLLASCPHLIGQECAADEGVVVKAAGAEVSVAAGQSVFQFVAFAGHHAMFVEAAVTILQTPFYEGPHLLCNSFVASLQAVATGSVGQHGGIATVEGTIDIVASADDAPGHKLKLWVDELEVATPRRHRALVAFVVPEEGEEGVDVLSLVVAPHGSIVRLASWGVHQSVLRLEDAFAGTYLAHLEERRDGVVGAIEVQVLHGNLFHEGLAVGEFVLDVEGCLLLVAGSVGLHRAIERGALAWLQRCLEVLLELCPRHQPVGAAGAVLLVGGANYVQSRHADGCLLPSDVLDDVLLADRSLRCAWEELPPEFEVDAVASERARCRQDAVDGDDLRLLFSHPSAIGRHAFQEICVAARHPAGVRVVGDGSEHGEDQVAVHCEVLLGIHAPVINHGGAESRHLDVVGIGQAALGGVPLHGVIAVDHPSVFLGLQRGSTHQEACQK